MLDAEYEARLRGSPIRSPGQSRRRSTPTRKIVYSDRFIPTRSKSLGLNAPSVSDSSPLSPVNQNAATPPEQTRAYPQSPSANGFNQSPVSPRAARVPTAYTDVLASELFGETRKARRVLSFSTERPNAEQERSTSPFALSPMSRASASLLRTPPKAPRNISSTPIRILEAPAIKDDFYLNLLDWSSSNHLAVGLANSVYLWNATTTEVTCLCDLGPTDSVTSVQWNANGTHLAVGTNKGLVQQWDVARRTKVRELPGHLSRVGAIAWRDNLLTSGSRDRLIYNRDIRERAASHDPITCNTAVAHKLIAHRQEVCGLEWSSFDGLLASGGNDNKLLVWDVKQCSKPLRRYTDHTAAVKAIGWSPHQRGLLASGGGTADRCLRFWNALSDRQTPLQCIDTGSQVCNVAWSHNVNELVSTHGYSQNQIVVWSYPEMMPLATLTGHSMRVLYLSVSPDGQTIVTGAGDETLRFWNVFPVKKRQSSAGTGSALRKLEIR